jgi:hypothetical protein
MFGPKHPMPDELLSAWHNLFKLHRALSIPLPVKILFDPLPPEYQSDVPGTTLGFGMDVLGASESIVRFESIKEDK